MPVERYELFILTEVTLPRLLLRVICGRKPILLFSDCLIRPLTGVFGWLERWLRATGRVRAFDAVPVEFPWLPRFPLEKNLTHGAIFAAEDHVQDHFRLRERLKPGLVEYEYPFRKAISDYSEKIKDLYLLMRRIGERAPDLPVMLHGAPEHLRLIQAYMVPNTSVPIARGHNAPVFFNLLNMLTIVSAGILWLLWRTRLVIPHPRRFLMAADRVAPIDHYYYKHFVDDPADLLIVDRNCEDAAKFLPYNESYTTCRKEDARIGVETALRLIVTLGREGGALHRRYCCIDSALYGRFCMLLVKRVMFAAFFTKYKPRFFWGRDDYSMDHVVRNQELRKIGGTSLGVSHGLPLNSYTGPWREVDFDNYYTFGEHLYRTCFKPLWSKNVRVKAVGSMQMTREYRRQLETETAPRKGDIGFFPVVLRNFDQIFDEAFKVAAHFKDRHFFVKMKHNRHPYYMNRFDEFVRAAPPNVIIYTDISPYPLLTQISYSICFTTLVAESLQFGTIPFTFDMDPETDRLYYRHFPDLLAANGEDVIRRIEVIEAGHETFDFGRFGELIKLEGDDLIDTVRKDIGLVPTGTPMNLARRTTANLERPLG